MCSCEVEERLVQTATDAGSAEVGSDGSEVDVRLTGSCWREEGDEEASESCAVVRDQARVMEVLKEEARECVCDWPSPPRVGDGDDSVVIMRRRGTDRQRAHEVSSAPR